MKLSTRKFRSAFSLIEIAIVLVIMAVSTSAMFLFLANSINETKKADNVSKIDFLNQAITNFYIKTGYLPCPAPSNAAISSSGYGISTTCSAGAVSGVTDTGAVRMGVIPVRTIGLPDDAGIDAYGNRFTYGIIKDFGINATTFDTTVASTTAMNINSYTLPGPVLTNSNILTTPNSLAYIIISHGQNSNGATTYSGVTVPCTAGSADSYNCDFSDTDFVDIVAVPGIFDDVVRWKTKQQLKYDKYTTLNLTNLTGNTYGKYGQFAHTVASGSASYPTGGTGATYYQRTINNVVANELSSAYLNGNNIILGPGTYLIRATAAACGVDRNLLEIYSNTTGTVLISGLAGYSDSTQVPTDCRNAYLVGVIILTQSNTIQLRHYIQTPNVVDGFGRAMAIGYNFNYANIEIWEM